MSLQFVVGNHVDSLGVTFLSLPPGASIINRVVPGSWAEVQKLRAVDELVSMNGSRVSEMTRHHFSKRIQERPLTLEVSRPSTKRSDETLGQSVISGGTVDALAEERHSDDVSGASTNSPSASSEGTVSSSFEQTSDDNLEDICAAQDSDEVSGKSAHAPRLDLVVDDGAQSLGITFFSLPPGAPIIDRVVPGSWAEVQKLRAGDELVYMNRSRVAEMTRHDFCKRIQERPLTLEVSRLSTKRSDETIGKSSISEGTVDSSFEQTLASGDNLEDINAAQNSDKVSGKSTHPPRLDLVVGDGAQSLGVAFLTLVPWGMHGA